jgi:hypothetical protein
MNTSDTTEPLDLCDCELSHNGMGMVGRECDCPIHYQRAAARAGTQVIRLRIALKIIREFGGFGQGYHAGVMHTMTKWMDEGMDSPVPWPDSSVFFDTWARSQGMSNIDGHVGYRLTMRLVGDHDA